MNNDHYIEFKKERDLGAIITDTFTFLRTEGKPFLITVFKISIVPILLAVAAILYYLFTVSDVLPKVNLSSTASNNNEFSSIGPMFLAMFLLGVFYILAYVSINIASMYYLKSYIDNKGVVDFDYVNEKVKNKFWSFLGLGILIGLVVIVGAFLCFFPAVYLYITVSLAIPIFVFQDKPVMDAFGDSFSFIKGHWWETFGVMFVVGLLLAVLGYVFSVPAIIYQLINGFTSFTTDDPTEVLGLLSDPVYLILNLLSYVGRFLFYAVSLVSSVFIYFDINEQKNASGTLEEINNLGQ
jgi:hypothetical protein